MDILTVVVIFLVIEIAICGMCWFTCRGRHVPGEKELSKATDQDSARHLPPVTLMGDPSRTEFPPTQHDLSRQEYARLIYLPPPISSVRDCE